MVGTCQIGQTGHILASKPKYINQELKIGQVCECVQRKVVQI